MIRRLRLKIVAAIFGTLLVVFTAVLLVLNLSVYLNSVRRADEFMMSVVENDGFNFPPQMSMVDRLNGYSINIYDSSEIMRSGRFFYVKIDQRGMVFDYNLDMMFDFDVSEIVNFLDIALSSGQEKGSIQNYSYVVAVKPYGYIVVFAERSIEINLLRQLTTTSLWVAGVAGLLLLGLTAYFSRWMVQPVQTAMDNQRRFISDASHELKTPLTIINANVDVLRNEIGDNPRLSHIKAQSDRMTGLVYDLLTLTRADEGQGQLLASDIDLSALVLNTALEFESRVFEAGRQYSYNIKENIRFTGDAKQIKQLLGILLDNAINYSDAAGQIAVSLQPEGSQARLSVFNTGLGVPDDQRTRIFERFYRIDQSRDRETGGYGVGLSVAQVIVEAHKGKISVTGEYGKWIRFDVLL